MSSEILSERDIRDCNWERRAYCTSTPISACGTILLVAPFSERATSLQFIGELGAKLAIELFAIPNISAIFIRQNELELFKAREAEWAPIENGVENIFGKLAITAKPAQ